MLKGKEKEGCKGREGREGKGRNYRIEKEGRCGNGRKDKHTLDLSLKHILLTFYESTHTLDFH